VPEVRGEPLPLPDAMTPGDPGRPATELELRSATEDDDHDLRALYRQAFNPPPDFDASFPDRFLPDRVLVGTAGGRVVGTAAADPVDQWFGGGPVPGIAVRAVAVDPFHRGRRVGHTVMRELLAGHRAAGRAYATLFASTVPLYRGLGFEYAGTYTERRVPLASLPSADSDVLEVCEVAGDDPGLPEVLRALARAENGVIEWATGDGWRRFVVGPHRGAPRTVVLAGGDEPEGYAAYLQERRAGDWRSTVVCSHLVAVTPRAGRALLGFFHRFRSMDRNLEWTGPAADPLTMLLPDQDDATADTERFLSRILDVPAALSGRRYPADVEADVRLGVVDDDLPENAGVYRLVVSGGTGEAIRVDDDPGAGGTQPMGIGALTALFSGFVTPFAARQAGLVGSDTAGLETLGRLFGGPAPWTLDHF
jgi:predicted acetyltransferase